MWWSFVPVAMVVHRPGEVASLGHGGRKMLFVGGGMNRGQRLVEQHRHKSEQTRQPVKAGPALLRDTRGSIWPAHGSCHYAANQVASHCLSEV